MENELEQLKAQFPDCSVVIKEEWIKIINGNRTHHSFRVHVVDAGYKCRSGIGGTLEEAIANLGVAE